MNAFWIGFGIIIIVIGLLELFFAILHYGGYGAISKQLQQVTWATFRTLSRFLPNQARPSLLSLGAPMMIPITIFFWVGVEIIGFALVFYGGMGFGYFQFEIPTDEAGFIDALYLSGITISTLGYGDIVPVYGFFRYIAIIEGLIGFGIMTLAISYIINIYSVIQHLRVMASALYHETENTGNIWRLIDSQFVKGQFRTADSYFRDLHRNLLAWYESVHQYQLAFYFYSTRMYLSIPYAFKVAGELVASLRFGLPSDHPAARNPALISFSEGLTQITFALHQQFLHSYSNPIVEPLPFEQFMDRYRNREQLSQIDWETKFIKVQDRMSSLATLDIPANPQDLYARYVAWLEFSTKINMFVQSSANVLAYPEIRLYNNLVENDSSHIDGYSN